MSYTEAPYTNHLGQTIQVGQNVVMIVMGRARSMKVCAGTYLGYYGDSQHVRSVAVRNTVNKWNGKKYEVKVVVSILPSKRIYAGEVADEVLAKPSRYIF